MSLLLLFKSSAPPGAGGSSGSPGSLPSLGLLLTNSYVLTAAQGSYSLSGVDANFPRTYLLTSAQGSYSLSGQDATLRTLPALVAEQGSYSLTGQDAALLRGYKVISEQGFYDLTGQTADLFTDAPASPSTPAPFPHLGLLDGLGNVPIALTAEYGTYTVSGQDLVFSATYILRADQGTYTTAGQVATLNLQGASVENPAPLPHLGLLLGVGTGTTILAADPGIYSIVGSDGLVDMEMGAETSTYAITGYAAGLNYQYYLTAAQGSYSLTGYDVTFTVSGNVTMAADQGTYTLSGQDAGTLRGYPMPALQGFYALGGQAADVFTGTSGTTGTVVVTNASDSVVAAGTTAIVGTVANTNSGDTLAASGVTDNTILGTVAYTNVSDILTSSGSGTNFGTLVVTNLGDTLVASGTTTVVGTLAKTNQNDTSSGYGYPGFPATVTTKLLLTGAGQT
jgi:hypothetical protein